MKLVHFVAALWLLSASPALATLAVDSAGINAFTVSGNSCTGATVTTSLGGDIIVVNTITTSSLATVTSVTDTAGLVWRQRAPASGNGRYTEEWWAYAPTTLTSDAITVNFSASFVACAVRGEAWNGANPTNPFDTNASLPATANSASASSLSVSISINNPNAAILTFLGAGGSGFGTLTRPTGFTNLLAGSFNDNSYKIVSAIQSNLSLSFSWTGGAQISLLLVDAIQAPLGPLSPSLNLSASFR